MTPAFDPTPFLLAIHLFVSVPVAALLAWLAALGYRRRGEPGLLWLGTGMLFWGAAGVAAWLIGPAGSTLAFNASSLLVWLAAFCLLLAVLEIQAGRIPHAPPGPSIARVYAGAAALMLPSVAAALWLPASLPEYLGGNRLGPAFAASALVQFALASVLLGRGRQPLPRFLAWFARGLALLGLGMLAGALASLQVGLPAWVGHVGLPLGSACFLLALLASWRETQGWRLPLDYAMRDANQRFEDRFDQVAEGMVVHAWWGGHLLRANAGMAALLGYSRAELLAMTADFLAPEDAPAARNAGVRHEKTLVAKDGRRIQVEIHTRRHTEQKRELALSMIRDISLQVRMESALRDSEQRFRLASGAVPVRVTVHDRALRILWDYGQRGRHDDRRRGDTLFTPEETSRCEAIKKRVLDEGIEVHEQRWFEPPDGRVCLDLYWEPIRDEGGRAAGVVQASLDLTTVKRIEAALAEGEPPPGEVNSL